MLGLSKRESKFFVNSFALHILILCLAGLVGFIPSCEEEKEEVHIFEMVTSAYVAPVDEKITETINLPKPPPTKIPPKPVLKSIPETQKTVQPKPQPKPKPPTTKKVAQKPKPVTQTPTKPKTISFNQFKKTHNLPTPQKKATVVQQAPKVKINSNFTLPKIRVSNSTNQNTSVDPTILNQYLARVKTKLESAWMKLQAGSKIAVEGEAYLSFRISSSGVLISPYISRSSGNATLDRLVLQVSKSVGNLGLPPGGKLSSSLEIPFKVQ